MDLYADIILSIVMHFFWSFWTSAHIFLIHLVCAHAIAINHQLTDGFSTFWMGGNHHSSSSKRRQRFSDFFAPFLPMLRTFLTSSYYPTIHCLVVVVVVVNVGIK
jgi:hypothetical protein